jgi:hypothetical protein
MGFAIFETGLGTEQHTSAFSRKIPADQAPSSALQADSCQFAPPSLFYING